MIVRGGDAVAAFVGRVPELGALIEAYATASSGTAATVLVGGEAGVGKSRLVRELASHGRRMGARVLVGHCLDLEEGGLPYAPFVDAVRTLERELPANEGGAAVGPLRAALGSPPGASEHGAAEAAAGESEPDAVAAGPAGVFGRARVFELLLTLVERITVGRPLVLVIEDVHWADRSTADLVTLLSTSARHLPLLLVVTYRTDDVGRRRDLQPLVGELTRSGATDVRLERLARGEVVELVGRLLGAPPGAHVAAAIADRSDGNPLFVEELVAAVAEEPTAPIPPQLRDAVLARVHRLSPDAARVLRTCAVAGRQVEHDLLALVVDRAGPAGGVGVRDDWVVEALRGCVEHQLLVVDNDLGGYRFRHALLHEAVLGEVLPGELVQLHRAYGRALSDDDPTVDRHRAARLAHHWSSAGDNDAALAAAVRAGVGADEAYATPEAHRYLEWAVRLWDLAADPVKAAGGDHGELLARAAAVANQAGAVDRARDLVEQAMATEPVAADPVRAGLLHERRGWYLMRAGRHADALEAYDRAVALVPEHPPSAARAHVAQAYGHALERAGQYGEARRLADEALRLAQATGDVADEGQARHLLGLVLAAEGRSDAAIGQLHQAGQIAAQLGDLAEVAGAYVHLWRTLVEAGRGGELVDLVVGFLPGTSSEASPSLMGAIAAAALHQLGRWDEADRLLADDPTGPGAGPAGGAGDSAGATAVARTLVTGALAVDRGDHDLARNRLETARAWCHQVGDGRLNGLLHRALASLAVWQERYDDARQEVATGLELLAHTGDPELEARLAVVGLRAEADRAAASRSRPAAGPTDEATTVADRLMAHLDELARGAHRRNAPPTSETLGSQLSGRAELSRFHGRSDPQLWRQAASTWEAMAFPHQAAYARYRSAEAALAAGADRDRAAHDLRSAHETVTRLDARPLAAAIGDLARRARHDLPSGAVRTITGTGPGAATGTSAGAGPGTRTAAAGGAEPPTAREAEVLALVAQGLTNRQIGETLFISRKTASVHVSRLLAKLGAHTRGEAAAIARRRGLLDD